MALRPRQKRAPEKWYRFSNVVDLERTAKGLILPGRHALYEFFDDFNGFTLAASGVTGWHLDESGSSTAAAIQDMAGGVVMAKPGGSATNNFQYQWATNTTVHEPIKLASGKRAWMCSRFKIEDADQNLIEVGCHIAADDPWNTEPSDQWIFRTQAADADALQLAIGATNSTENTISLGNLENDTWVTCLAFFDGASTCHAWRFDDTGAVTNSGRTAITTLPDTEMTVAWGAEAVDTGADDFHVDFIYVGVER